MKMDRKALCHKLKAAKEAETVPKANVNAYLLEKVLSPTLMGKAPRLNEINYDQFEEEDIEELADYCEQLEITSGKLSRFVGAVAFFDAIPCRTRQFC